MSFAILIIFMFVAFGLTTLFRKWMDVPTLLAVAINAYIIMHSCLDAAQSTEASSGVIEVTEEVVNTVSPGTITPENHDSFVTFIRKAFGHFGLFVISGLLSSLAIYFIFNPFKWSKYWLLIIFALAFGLMMGMLTEIIQLNVPGRSGEFKDVLIDFSGYLFGFLIILLILFLIIRKQNKKKQVTE